MFIKVYHELTPHPNPLPTGERIKVRGILYFLNIKKRGRNIRPLLKNFLQTPTT